MIETADAWRELMASLDAAGAAVAGLAGEVPDVDVAEGYRYLLDVLGDQLDRAAVRHSGRPLLLPGVTPVRKLFFDNPDAHYATAAIRGDRTYRIRGERGDACYLAVCAYAGNVARGEPTRVANLSDADMAFAPDGTFEVTLAPEGRDAPSGNRLPLAPDAHTVIVRRYHLDRERPAPAPVRIEAQDDPGPDPVLDGARFARQARTAAAFLRAAAAVALQRAEDGRARPNRFVEAGGHGLYGTPDAGYVACWYRLAPGEALVVEGRPPPCRYWGVHLANRWGQSLDHRTRTTALNAGSVTTGPDAPFRIVVAAEPPGDAGGARGADWLDTAGHPEGWVLFRWLLAAETVVPEARVVTRAAVGGRAG